MFYLLGKSSQVEWGQCFCILRSTSPSHGLSCVCVCVCVCARCHFSHVQVFAILRIVALQAPLSMGFSRQEYWSQLSCPPPGGLPRPGIKPVSLKSSALQVDSLLLSYKGSPHGLLVTYIFLVNQNLIQLGSHLVISLYLVQFAFLSFAAVHVLRNKTKNILFLCVWIYLKTCAVHTVELASGDFAVRRVYLSSCILLQGTSGRGASGKELTCQCRRHKRYGFDPWFGMIPWKRTWQSTSVFLHGEFHGQRSLAGCNPRGRKELDMTEVTQHACIVMFCDLPLGTHLYPQTAGRFCSGLWGSLCPCVSGVSCSRQWRRCLLRSLLRSGSWRAQVPVLSAQSGELYWYRSCLFPTSQFRVRITATKQSRLSAFVLAHLEGLNPQQISFPQSQESSGSVLCSVVLQTCPASSFSLDPSCSDIICISEETMHGYSTPRLPAMLPLSLGPTKRGLHIRCLQCVCELLSHV